MLCMQASAHRATLCNVVEAIPELIIDLAMHTWLAHSPQAWFKTSWMQHGNDITAQHSTAQHSTGALASI